MKILLMSGALALTAMTAAFPLKAANIEIEAEGPVIELSVYESVTAEPDMATIGAGVTTEAKTAIEAMRLNSVEMQKVIDRIKALGVDEKDIQTTGINLNALYDYDRMTQRQVFRGYQVSNRVSVKLREIEQTGKVLDALVVAGANNLTGPSFSIEDDEAAKDEARKRAIKRAQGRAEAYAALFGYDGVKVLQVSESISGNGGPVPEIMMRVRADEMAAAAPPVQPGMVSTGVSISIKYEMIGGDD